MSVTQLHRVTWDGDHPTFHCDGALTDKCHNYPACGCEEWSEDHQHPAVPQDECWLMPWLSSSAPEDTYEDAEGTPGSVPHHDAPITWSWESDYVTWMYADDGLNVPPAADEDEL